MAIIADQRSFRHYLYFLSGQQFSLLGSSVVQFAIIWWITIVTESPLYLSLAAILGFAPLVFLGPFTGVFADRFNRKNMIILADFGQSLATIVLIVFFLLDLASVFVVLILLFIRGIFQAFHSPAVQAIVPSMVPKEKLNTINSLEYILNGVVQLGGPVIGALLLVFASIEQVLWIDPITFAVAVAILIFIKIPSVRERVGDSSFRKDFKEGFSFVRGARGLLTLIFLATILNFLIAPLSTLLPYFVKFIHSGGVTDLALVQASIQGGFFLGGAIMLISKGGFRRKTVAFTFSLIISFVGYSILSSTPTGLFVFMMGAALILAIPLPVANISARTIIQTIVPLEMQGRVVSVVISLASLATPLGMIISGPLATYAGTSNLFLGCSVIGIATTILAWLFTDIRQVEKIQDTKLSDSLSNKS
jgi:DHA3 family macrolide efflux protein-like MFS transporter